MSIGKTENFSSAGQDDPDRSNILLTTLPDCVDSCDENSLEASAFGSLKRKHASEIDSVEDRRKKCTPDLSYCVSPWEFRRLKADLMESQAQRIKLEDRIDQLHKKNKEAVIFFDKEKNEMKSQLESNRNTIKDLEFRLNKVRKRETECKGELIEKTKELEFLKLSHDEKVLKLETENRNMKTRVSQLEVDHDEEIIALNNCVKELKHNNGKLELQLLEKEELCSSLNSKLTTAMESSKKLEEVQSELFIAQLRIKELQNEADEFREAKNITLALSEKALRVPDLEKELNDKKLQVANLKQFLHNNIILEEMVQNLKTKLATFEAKQNELPGLKAKLVELESELENWKLLASDFSNDCTRHSLGAYIESLQKKELTATLEVNSLNGEIKSCEKKLSCVQTELEAAKVHNEKLQGVLHKLKVEVQLLRKKSVLISRERDSYRQQLDLYEKDLTLTGFPAENPTGDASFQTKSRIHNLELSLSEYRKHIETLENQLKEYQMEEPETIEKNCKLMEQVKKLEEANMMLTKMKDKLEEKLESRASKGEYLSPNTKIVHFRNNPVYEAEKQQEIELNELKEERDKLRARVKLLESGEVLNITQKVSEDLKNCTSQRIAELEKELQSANLKMQRLKEFFKKTSQEFRDVSYMLLGYRIDLASNSKLYKLYNMYSTSPSDFLMFQQTEKGTMEMLGTSFAESLSKLVDEYLHVGNSIPAFLSAVTLQLYGSTAQSDEDDEDEEDDDNVVNPDDRNDDSNDDGNDDDDNDDDDDEDDDEGDSSDNNMVIDVESCIKKVRKKSSSIEPIELD